MDELEKLRHSAAHILAYAVKRLYPKAKLAIGPSIEEGFYYDFDNLAIKEEDLPKIEQVMKEIIKKDYPFQKTVLTRQKAKILLKNEPYKLELLQEIKGKISFYQSGDFIDLCSGPHVKSTGQVKAIKLLRLAGAYWKGQVNNKMLTRIYGTAFPSEKELDDYLTLKAQLESRDHKKIGRQLDLFMLSDLVGKGLPIWLPKGEIIKMEIEKLALELENQEGYLRVSTPHIAKEELFKKSGHLQHFQDTMYPKMKIDDGEYYLKAMNCPMHHIIFSHGVKSYKDLPVKIAEYGIVYRNELSGTLAGLLRVRMLSMNDAHIYCRKDQIANEVESVIRLTQKYYDIFGFKDYYFRLSLWDPKQKARFINEPSNWKYTQEELRKVLKKLKIKFVEAIGEAAFYGPKIDIQFKAVTGREETLSTIQLDFSAKSRFDFRYFDVKGMVNKEVFVIHRAPLSTHERFIAFLIEHYTGNFPLWLAPVQIRFLTLTDRNVEFASKLVNNLKEKGFRIELDQRQETMSKKVHDAQLAKIPLMITIGDKEEKNNTVSIRTLDGKVTFGVNVEDFIKDIEFKVKNRK